MARVFGAADASPVLIGRCRRAAVGCDPTVCSVRPASGQNRPKRVTMARGAGPNRRPGRPLLGQGPKHVGRAHAGEWAVDRKWPRATRTRTEMHFFFLFSEAF